MYLLCRYLSLRLDGRVRGSGVGYPPWNAFVAQLPPVKGIWSGILDGMDGRVLWRICFHLWRLISLQIDLIMIAHFSPWFRWKLKCLLVENLGFFVVNLFINSVFFFLCSPWVLVHNIILLNRHFHSCI